MKQLLIVVLGVLVAGTTCGAWAGPYSGASGEANPYDQGIAGFVGGEVNPVFVGWATDCVEYDPFDLAEIQGYMGGAFAHPEKALGAVTGSNGDIVSLGDMDQTEIDAWLADSEGNHGPGSITLTFAGPIYDGEGADFAVFENSFLSGSKVFAELGYVEVSSDGEHFARFPSVSLTAGPVGGYGTIDATDVYNLVGKHVNASGSSWGTPFDLDDLVGDPLVAGGTVDLGAISHVRIVDIPGSGDFLDSQTPASGIYDAWVTWGSGGVDLEAVGVIHGVPEPGSLVTCVLGAAALLIARRRRRGDSPGMAPLSNIS
jgi:hypothetical protein